MKTAYFYLSASPNLGAGHAVRASVLADALLEQGWQCNMVTDQKSYNFFGYLEKYHRVNAPSTLSKLPECDLLVIDDYNIGIKEEQEAKNISSKLLVMEDLPNKSHYCDYLLDQTYLRNGSDYSGLVPENCVLLMGSSYGLIRKSIRHLRYQTLRKKKGTNKIENIIVSFGAGFHKQMIAKTLRMIEKSSYEGVVNVVLGLEKPPASHICELEKVCSCSVKFHVNPKMENLLIEADLVIGGAGSSILERSCLGIPQIVFQVADNQTNIVKFFPEQSLEYFLSSTQKNVCQQEITNQTDGLGVYRLLNTIDGRRDKNNQVIRHRKVASSDMKLIYKFHAMDEIRRFSHQRDIVSKEEHKRWFLRKIKSPLDIFELILCGGLPCGTLRLDYSSEEDAFVLSFYVIPEFQSRGIGQIILEYAKQLSNNKRIDVFVYRNNEVSQYLFTKANFSINKITEEGIYYVH